MDLRGLIAALALIPFLGFARYEPMQADLNAALANAEARWGEHTAVNGISMARFPNDCRGRIDRAGEADLAALTIRINAACVWDRELLDLVFVHEYGHLLLQTSAHSLDKRSAMYFELHRGQVITPEDREWLAAHWWRNRPTLKLSEPEDR